MATTPKLVGPADPALAKSFQNQTPSVVRTSPPTVSATGSATSTGGTASRSIAPSTSGDTTTYSQATQASSGTELFIVSSNSNDSNDIVTVYNTQKEISVSAVNQTINNYKVTTTNNTYGDSNVVTLLSAFGSNTISTTGLITGNGGGLSNVPYANVTGTPTLGNIASTNYDGNASNVLHGDGTWSADQTTYGNSNVVTLLSAFGSNTITTTGNISAGNIIATNIGNIANINLTGSNSNVLYGNGVFAPASGGANTGNWEFVDNTMYNMAGGEINNGDPTHGATSGLILPNNGNAGGGTSLFNTYGNIQVSVANLANSANTKVWTFDTTGNLNTAGDIVGPANANFTIYSNAAAHEFIFADDGTFYAPDNVVLGGDAIYIGPGANTLTGIEHEVFIASSNHFAYVQGVINNVSDNGSAEWVALGAKGDDSGGWGEVGFTSSGFGDANYTITGAGDGYVFAQAYANGSPAPAVGGGNLVLATGNQGTTKDIIFGTGGFLTGNIFGRISHANNSLELSRTGATITFPDSTEQNTAWTGSVTRIANGNSNVSVPTSSDNVYINVNSGSSKQWVFDTSGNLRTPGNVDIYGAINFPQQVSSLNWSTYNIELSQYGRITTNVDFFANANTIGALYLKGDGSNISNIAVANIVGLGNIATANLDGSNSNVLYGNGVFAPASGGNANTGNVTFDDVTVQGVNGLNLSAGADFTANLAYLQVRAGDVPSHIHLDTGNNEAYDLIVGDDQNYVQVSSTGNILLSSYDSNTAQYIWTLDYNGNLILAGGNSVIQSIANSSLDPTLPNVSTMVLTPDQGYSSQSLVLDPTAPGHIHLRAYAFSNIDEPSANIFLGGEDTAFEITSGANNQAVIHSNGKAWTFGNDGNITSDTLTFTTTFANVKTVEYQTAGVWDLYVEDSITGSNTASSRLNVSFKDNLIDKPQVYIENTKESDGIALRWTFDENGNLNLPGNLVIAGNTSVFGTNSSLLQTTDDLPLIAISSGANGAVSSVWVEDVANVGTSNIAAVYANPTVGSGIVRIAVGQNGGNAGPNLWDFDAAGNLTLPTGGQIIVSGGLVSSGASPAPTINGFSITNSVGISGNGNIAGNNISATGAVNANTANITTGNITTINSGLLQNGNSNITITANGNVSIQAAGSNVELVVTSTGANVTGTLTSTGKIGYASGSTVTQTTNRGNGVTINALAGTIITTSVAMAANEIDTFSVINSSVDPNTDIVLAQIVSPNLGTYNCIAGPAIIGGFDNGFYINIVNISGFTTSDETITIRFMVIKAPNA